MPLPGVQQEPAATGSGGGGGGQARAPRAAREVETNREVPTEGFNYVSFFSGIGGFDLGLRAAGFTLRLLVEADKALHPLLHKTFPDVPIHGCITELKRIPDGVQVSHAAPRPSSAQLLTDPSCDGQRCGYTQMVCGGWPCAQLSRQGKRGGLKRGTPSGLFYDMMDLVKAANKENRPIPYVLLENVPGETQHAVRLLTALAMIILMRPPASLPPSTGVRDRNLEGRLASITDVTDELSEMGYVWAYRECDLRCAPALSLSRARRKEAKGNGHLAHGVLFQMRRIPSSS